MAHYLMVAKLSIRCFSLVLRLGQENKVTQSDFLDLYKKSEEEQYQLLKDLTEGTRTFEDLKKGRVCIYRTAPIYSGLSFALSGVL